MKKMALYLATVSDFCLCTRAVIGASTPSKRQTHAGAGHGVLFAAANHVRQMPVITAVTTTPVSEKSDRKHSLLWN